MIELRQDSGFTRRFSRVQRVGWSLFVAIVILTLAGLTGGGGLWAREQAGAANWPRVMRVGASETLQTIAPLHLDPAVGRHFAVEFLTPTAEADGRQVIRLSIRPRAAGLVSFRLETGLSGPKARVQVTVLILP